MDGTRRARLLAVSEKLASESNRLLAVAYRMKKELPTNLTASELENDLTFLGLAGLIDPPRPETPEAVARCKKAGIRSIMVTDDSTYLTGLNVDEMDREELQRSLEGTDVFARVSPHHKLRIVEALQERGEVMAMTGDGFNDAPALNKANIGIAMGIRCTDVSKDAA